MRRGKKEGHREREMKTKTSPLPTHTHRYITACSTCGGHKRASDPLELEFEILRATA